MGQHQGLTGLNVNYDPASGKVALSGSAASAEAMQKAVLIAGNVQGVGEVDVAQVQAPAEKEKVEYYIIKSGDNCPRSPSSSTATRTNTIVSSRRTAK